MLCSWFPSVQDPAIGIHFRDLGEERNDTTKSISQVRNVERILNLHMITPGTQSWVIETTGNRVVEGIQRRGVLDSLYRESFDVFIGVDAKVNPRNGGGHRSCEGRHDVPVQLLEQRVVRCLRP